MCSQRGRCRGIQYAETSQLKSKGKITTEIPQLNEGNCSCLEDYERLNEVGDEGLIEAQGREQVNVAWI